MRARDDRYRVVHSRRLMLSSGNSSLQRGFRSSAIYFVPRLEKAILGLHEYHISILALL